MKKVVVLLMLVFLFAGVAQAKTLKEALNEMTIEGTSEGTRNAVEKAGDGAVVVVKVVADGVKHTAYYLVKGVLHAVATPFYWLEKVAK